MMFRRLREALFGGCRNGHARELDEVMALKRATSRDRALATDFVRRAMREALPPILAPERDLAALLLKEREHGR